MTGPRPSATIVLARDSAAGPELLYVKRRSGDAFGESYTFPGGVVDGDERNARGCLAGIAPDDANAMLGLGNGGLDYYSAAVRELFEETAILPGSGGPIDEALRERLLHGKLGWSELLAQTGVAIPCDELHYFAHWITPEGLAKRWSTRFFLARMPAGQAVRPDGQEITDYCWLTAADALASARLGERSIPFPTRTTTSWLEELDTVAEIIDWAGQRQANGITAIQPMVRFEDGKMCVFLPDSVD